MKQDFNSRSMTPNKTRKESAIFTLKPKIKKTYILRKREPKMALIAFVEEINVIEKLKTSKKKESEDSLDEEDDI